MKTMFVLHLLSCVALMLSAVHCETEDFIIREDVNCKVFSESRTILELISVNQNNQEKMMISEITVVKCKLNKHSGFTYNVIGRNISDFYAFHYDEGKISPQSDIFRSFINKDNNSESRVRLFEASFESGDWQLLPNGFYMIVPIINSLNVTSCGLTILDKLNLEQFGDHLISANFADNLLIFLARDLFEFNHNLKYCDFSDNPLQHIDDYYFDSAIPMNFYFNNISCIKGASDSLNENYVVDCNNPTSFISYKYLKKNLKRNLEEAEIFCAIRAFCVNEQTYPLSNKTADSVTYTCNMTVVNPRTFVSNKMQFTYSNDRHGQCERSTTETSLEFHSISYMEYIPRQLADIIKLKIRSLNIIRCGLGSINEYDMRQFGENLRDADFSFNKINAIGKNVFRHNNNLVSVNLIGNPILYIDVMEWQGSHCVMVGKCKVI